MSITHWHLAKTQGSDPHFGGFWLRLDAKKSLGLWAGND